MKPSLRLKFLPISPRKKVTVKFVCEVNEFVKEYFKTAIAILLNTSAPKMVFRFVIYPPK